MSHKSLNRKWENLQENCKNTNIKLGVSDNYGCSELHKNTLIKLLDFFKKNLNDMKFPEDFIQ